MFAGEGFLRRHVHHAVSREPANSPHPRTRLLTGDSAIILVNLGLTIWALVPTEADRTSVAEDSDSDSSPTRLKGKQTWEKHGIPPTPSTANMPYTPRTMAFNTLERKLPLRQYR